MNSEKCEAVLNEMKKMRGILTGLIGVFEKDEKEIPDIENISKQLSWTESKVEGISNFNIELSHNLSRINGRVEGMENVVRNLQEMVKVIQKDMQKLLVIDRLSQDLDGITTRVKTCEDELNTLDEQITILDGSITDHLNIGSGI